MTVRRSIAAGRFYPSSKDEIDRMLSKYDHYKVDFPVNDIIGGVLPHAGYIFCLKELIPFFEILKEKKYKYDTVIILSPNHTGYGPEFSVDSNNYWESPYGNVELDEEFIKTINIEYSQIAQKFEHSGEVILPLLKKHINNEFKIVPINIKVQNYENSLKIAKKIFETNKILNRKILIIASSDFSHYVSVGEGERKDKFITDKILAFDSEGVYKEIREKKISVCGYSPIMTLIEYSKLVSEKIKVKSLMDGHSGEVIDSEKVVFYRSFLFYRY